MQVPHVWRYICKSSTHAWSTCSMQSWHPFIHVDILNTLIWLDGWISLVKNIYIAKQIMLRSSKVNTSVSYKLLNTGLRFLCQTYPEGISKELSTSSCGSSGFSKILGELLWRSGIWNSVCTILYVLKRFPHWNGDKSYDIQPCIRIYPFSFFFSNTQESCVSLH